MHTAKLYDFVVSGGKLRPWLAKNVLPPVPEKLWLEVGTPWVNRVYDRKSVPGFFDF